MNLKIRITAPLLLSITLLVAACGGSKNLVEVEETENNAVVDTGTIPQKPEVSKITDLQKKYAGILNVTPKEITNEKLYKFVDKWLGTPYKLGGESARGIDCSYLAQHLYVYVYDYLLERTSSKQAEAESTEQFIGQEYLKEGDLLFFKRPTKRSKVITHVGIYLQNNMFVSASGYKGPEKKRGVKISDLKDEWWQERFMFAGRKPLNIYTEESEE